MTIQTDPNIDHELIVGIGNKVFKEDRFVNKKRVVGITTMFSGDGSYELSNTSKDVPFEDYLDELLQSLNTNINHIRKKNNWQKGDTLRLIFHVFKPFRDDEIDSIEKVVNELQKDFEVQYAYITISHHHPYLLFDETQGGRPDYRNDKKLKGVWQPNRGTALQLDQYSCLLQLIGPNEIKTHLHGLSAPVLIKLHKKSTFKSLPYLVKQIYKFSYISWRSFFPASHPITIDYSNQIADLLGSLRETEGWNSSSLMKLKYKAWFL